MQSIRYEAKLNGMYHSLQFPIIPYLAHEIRITNMKNVQSLIIQEIPILKRTQSDTIFSYQINKIKIMRIGTAYGQQFGKIHKEPFT